MFMLKGLFPGGFIIIYITHFLLYGEAGTIFCRESAVTALHLALSAFVANLRLLSLILLRRILYHHDMVISIRRMERRIINVTYKSSLRSPSFIHPAFLHAAPEDRRQDSRKNEADKENAQPHIRSACFLHRRIDADRADRGRRYPYRNRSEYFRPETMVEMGPVTIEAKVGGIQILGFLTMFPI